MGTQPSRELKAAGERLENLFCWFSAEVPEGWGKLRLNSGLIQVNVRVQ